MGLIDEIKSKIDQGDGRISRDHLEGLKHNDGSERDSMIDKLKARADANGDGNISLDDAKSALGNIGNLFR